MEISRPQQREMEISRPQQRDGDFEAAKSEMEISTPPRYVSCASDACERWSAHFSAASGDATRRATSAYAATRSTANKIRSTVVDPRWYASRPQRLSAAGGRNSASVDVTATSRTHATTYVAQRRRGDGGSAGFGVIAGGLHMAWWNV